MADPGFPVGGRCAPMGGRGPPMQVLFGENVCENKRIGSHRGWRVPGTPPQIHQCISVDVCETNNMDLFNKVHIFEPTKNHIYEPNISLISLISLMFNYAKPRLKLNNTIDLNCTDGDLILNEEVINERRASIACTVSLLIGLVQVIFQLDIGQDIETIKCTSIPLVI